MESAASDTARSDERPHEGLAGAGRPLASVVMRCLDEPAAISRRARRARETMAGAALSGEVIVVHNDVTGGSPERARAAGAAVVSGPRRGYGHAGPPNVLYRARVSDSHCGMRAFRRFSPLADGVRHLRRLVGAAPRRRSASAER